MSTESSVRPEEATDPSESSPQIVAIGASAGGLEALEKLFAGLSSQSGATFVVIQHLSPDHKSMMANLLARHTAMPVVMVEQDMLIEPNRVYLIPPGSIMHMGAGKLTLTPKSPRTLTLPIDVFFKSMAEHYGVRSVGVVLSGTGSDGTRGAAAINDAGGFLIAQEPDDAKFDGMPRSVIATGLVDAILPVDQIGARLLAHINNQPIVKAAVSLDTINDPLRATSPEAALNGIMHLLLQVGGIDFQEYKTGTVMRRIERRMNVCQVTALENYLELLNSDRHEVLTLRRELLIPVTSFFRDTEAFDILSRQVIEPLVARKQAGESVRIWLAAVSTGEEAYSVAMLLLEAFDQLKHWPTLKIFATDVEQQNIETAGAGTYPESIAAEVSPQQLERFFVKKGNTFAVKNELRQCIVFARHNLLTDPPFTRMDLVVCRNALIYFRPGAQERALKRLQYALLPGAHLFLGSSESLGELNKDFTTVSARHKIWQMVRAMGYPLEVAKSSGYGYPSIPLAGIQPLRPGRLKPTLVEQGFNTLLKAFAPPAAILVNARHELMHSYGEVNRFVRLREGHASLDMNRILPEPLVPVAVALVFKASREGTSVISDRLKYNTPDGSVQYLRLSAWPVEDSETDRLTLLAFEQLHATSTVPEPMTAIDLDSETAERMEVLERELTATRESLQATVEELETSNEELQSTNEELMSSNEELQSSNEELQSVNEELNTVNAEYQEKIDILNRLNADLDNMAQAVAAGTVFVDDRLNLTRFSPDATHIFRLRDSDLGRPLDDLAHTLLYPELIADLSRTLKNEIKIEKEVRGINGLHYFVRMLPYRVPSSSNRGAVISFMDVTALHEVSRLQSIIDALSEHIAVLNSSGVITLVNSAWRRFAIENGDAELTASGPGVNYLGVWKDMHQPPDASIGDAERGVREVLEGRSRHFTLEYPCHSPTEQRWFVMNVGPVGGEQPGVVVSHLDVTQWRAKTQVQPS
ncbi:MAG: PAS domain-containing protein [Rhodoferax sp.]|jgi:two-component system CheB/CheR fusion protein|uniref:chemotaxis protein CheB n=1 Tax=Rhodoferax sp. TaxID=50421 RepID=UPI001B4DAFC3|nr:chemotaxis protein CheB [Rhodoferax sp.]MBP8285219.1 PAS domain-containing protein [Rhodoferax sp.]MBP9148009.1 PAS domain-containing protein [Rhodoferax sp.]MBP9734131.1 PAS domain-containing protein [Rhodoferax sp.]